VLAHLVVGGMTRRAPRRGTVHGSSFRRRE